MEFAYLTVTVNESIAHVQLNRPHKANALHQGLWDEIKKVFDWADQATEIHVIVLSGTGKCFSAGIDFELLTAILRVVHPLNPGLREERLRRIILELQDAFMAIERCRKPVLAAIHGVCLGAGLDLAAMCDMRYASQEAQFSVKEVDLGIVADLGSLQRLPHLIGEGLARELAFTGRSFSAVEAHQMGFVNQLFDHPEQLLQGALWVARSIAAKPPLAIRGIKEVMNYSRDHSLASGLNFVATWNSSMLLSDDTQKAITAILKSIQ